MLHVVLQEQKDSDPNCISDKQLNTNLPKLRPNGLKTKNRGEGKGGPLEIKGPTDFDSPVLYRTEEITSIIQKGLTSLIQDIENNLRKNQEPIVSGCVS